MEPVRAKPIADMSACARTCKIREEAANLALEDQVALIRGCHEQDMAEYAACAAKQRKLAEWIQSE